MRLITVFFLEVGANDGIQFDPLYELVIKHKLSGILIEPDMESFTQLQHNYKEVSTVRFENSAVSEYDGVVDLYCGKTNLHYTLSHTQAKYMFDIDPYVKQVPAITFKTLFTKYKITTVDLLLIDVEGYDFKLLKTFPFDMCKPTIVRCEFTHISNENNTLEEMVDFLTQYNYECYYDEHKTDIIAIQRKPITMTKSGKTRFRIHNPCNEHTRYFRYYNLFWDALTHELKLRHDVEENRYYEKANAGYFPIELTGGNAENLTIQECEYVIENLDTKEFFVLSVNDDLSSIALVEQNNPNLKKVLIAQYISDKIDQHVLPEHRYKHIPWIYFPSDLTNLDQFYFKRQYLYKHNLIDKMYFRGWTQPDARPILCDYTSEHIVGYEVIGSQPVYFNDLIKYKVGLSVGGRGELCYRDIEYMALGIPMLRFEFLTELSAPLKPNYHYISVPLPEDIPRDVYDIRCDKFGTNVHAQMLVDKFLEVKDNTEFLNFVATNARTYYEKYLAYPSNVKHTLNLLGI